jgi:HSP20 family protein
MTDKKKKAPLWFEEPTVNLRNIQEEMMKNMQEIIRMPVMPQPAHKYFDLKSRIIPIRLADADRDLLLLAELPGFTKDEIKLRVTQNSVDISAEKKKVSSQRGENFASRQSISGSTRRVFPLPIEIKPERVRAKFENGMLKITLPKKEIENKDEKEISVD